MTPPHTVHSKEGDIAVGGTASEISQKEGAGIGVVTIPSYNETLFDE